jgi:N-acetylglucosamine kinase-like BadF-type ATPase
LNIIGIDAGGTKTYAAVINREKNILFTFKTGPGNVSVHYPEAKNNIAEAINACLSSPHGEKCNAIVAGIAGIGSGNIKRKLHKDLSKLFSLPILIINDAELSYYSMFDRKEGVLAIAGTGTVIIGRKNGVFKTVGGWGHLLGDEGSAYDIAIKSLKILATEFEQGSLTSKFSKTIADKYRLHKAELLKEYVYSSTKSGISKISSFVYEMAKKGDEKSISLFQEAGRILAHQTFRLIELLQFSDPINIGCKGSLFEKNEFLKQSFVSELQKEHDVLFINNNTNAVIGAVPAWEENWEGR